MFLKGSRSPEVFDFRFSVDLFRIWPVLGILLGRKVNRKINYFGTEKVVRDLFKEKEITEI